MQGYIGTIMLFAGNFPPVNWYYCQGQKLAISSYNALYSIIGNQYGGDGSTYFNLPDLRGRGPIGSGNGPGLTPRIQAQRGGSELVTLMETQMPTHNHIITNTPKVANNLTVTASGEMKCSGDDGNSLDPSGAFLAQAPRGGDTLYTTDASEATGKLNAAAMEIDASLQGDIQVGVTSQCGMSGANEAHQNMQPWLCLNYIICYDGAYPNRS